MLQACKFINIVYFVTVIFIMIRLYPFSKELALLLSSHCVSFIFYVICVLTVRAMSASQ
jgi:hypothetical protein